MAIACGNYFIKQSFCHTFPVIPKAQRKTEQNKQYLGIPKDRYQVQFISVVNLNLFVWFMKAKVYKVESCTVYMYFALNFPPCCLDYPIMNKRSTIFGGTTFISDWAKANLK